MICELRQVWRWAHACCSEIWSLCALLYVAIKPLVYVPKPSGGECRVFMSFGLVTALLCVAEHAYTYVSLR